MTTPSSSEYISFFPLRFEVGRKNVIKLLRLENNKSTDDAFFCELLVTYMRERLSPHVGVLNLIHHQACKREERMQPHRNVWSHPCHVFQGLFVWVHTAPSASSRRPCETVLGRTKWQSWPFPRSSPWSRQPQRASSATLDPLRPRKAFFMAWFWN